MPLTLTIRNATALENGSPISLVLDRRGAKIGRAATADWCLPDPSLHISSQHCEIRFTNDRFELLDRSTNGTFLLGETARLADAHPISQGDVFIIGRFEIEARLDDEAAAESAQRNAAAPPPPQWQGWAAAAGQPEPQSLPGSPPAASGWDSPPVWHPETQPPPAGQGSGTPVSGGSGWGATPSPAPPSPGGGWAPEAPQGSAWGPPAAHPDPTGAASPWNAGPAEQASAASAWSSPSPSPQPPSANDIWGRFAASNDVDWNRGGFGHQPMPRATAATANFVPPSQAPQPTPPAAPASHTPAPAPASPPAGQGVAALATAAGLNPGNLRQGETETLSVAGLLLHKLVGGLVILLEARTRAKSQMGARGTSLELDGNNPLKFARAPEMALVQLLNATERGFMEPERAIEDAFKDLQAHQMATLLAMQGALRVTLERFSPNAIRARAEKKGLLARILPGARDAALWKAYEKDFSQVSLGSDEAFMDMFAKEFRRAYDEISARS